MVMTGSEWKLILLSFASKGIAMAQSLFRRKVSGNKLEQLFSSFALWTISGLWTPSCWSKEDANQCDSDPCQNGGTCVDQLQAYVCLCPEEYKGKNCEKGLNDTLKCIHENGHCEHYCIDSPTTIRQCFCSDGYMLANDEVSCTPQGEHRIDHKDEGEQERKVSEIIMHEKYIPGTTDHDIALLHLEAPVNFSDYVVPICLPEKQFATSELSAIRFSTMSVMAGQLLLILLSTSIAGLLQAEGNVFLQEENANKFLGRTKRANSFFEELKKGNIERECYEERCSKEEAREAFEDTEKTDEFWNKYIDGDQCKLNPCQYGATCKDGIGTYTCTCLDGYQGKNCESVIPKYCKLNNGDCGHFCRPERNGVECFCATGYILGPDEKSCIPTEPFPCGKVYVKRKKRSVISFGNSSSVTSEQDGNPNELYSNNGTSHRNITSIADSPDLLLQNETKAPNRTENDPKTNVSPNPHTRIVGGNDCLPGECPWQALLINEDKEGFCGGTILNQFYILTAAHCINQSKIIKVVVGEVDRDKEENTEMMISVEKIFVHDTIPQQAWSPLRSLWQLGAH
ncbi:unnamed protein product [Caretta caretta]